MVSKLLLISGPPGVGKSEIAQRLAKSLEIACYDVDVELERSAGRSTRAVIHDEGWSGFRAREAQVVAELIERVSASGRASGAEEYAEWSAVISLGGGSLLDSESRARARAAGVLVTLWATPALLETRQRERARIEEERDRPLPSSDLASLVSARLSAYLECDVWLESLQGESPEQLTYRLSRALLAHQRQGSAPRWCTPPDESTLRSILPTPPSAPASATSTWITSLQAKELAEPTLEVRSHLTDLEATSEPTSDSTSEPTSEPTMEISPQVTSGLPLKVSAKISAESQLPETVLETAPMSEATEVTVSQTLYVTGYPVYFRRDAEDELIELIISSVTQRDHHADQSKATSTLIIVSDEVVARLYSGPLVGALQRRGFKAHLLTFPTGDKSKSLRVLEALATRMLKLGVNRDDWLIALGGGVTGDLCGLLAALYMRGVKWAQVPTSLLAQVDSSVGAKTAVNHPLGKNLLGAFYRPEWVWVDVDYIWTLPPRELRAGLVEALKHGLIADASLFSTLVALGHLSPQTDRDREQWRTALRRAVKVKASIVERDERERGERALLNFGHTFGHAFETCSADLLHGEAVALGIALSLEYSVCYGELSRESLTAATEALSSVELSIDWRPHLSDAVWSAIALDKKRTSDKLKFIVLREIGEAYVEEVTLEDLSSRVKALVHL